MDFGADVRIPSLEAGAPARAERMMKTINLVDPELRPFLAEMPTTTYDMEGLRERRANPIPTPEAAPNPDLEVTERFVPGPAGAPHVRVVIYRPKSAAAPFPAILHIHGGGYIVGVPETDDAYNRGYAAEL